MSGELPGANAKRAPGQLGYRSVSEPSAPHLGLGSCVSSLLSLMCRKVVAPGLASIYKTGSWSWGWDWHLITPLPQVRSYHYLD